MNSHRTVRSYLKTGTMLGTACALGLVLSACSSGGGTSGSGSGSAAKGNLTIATVAPFSGSDAGFGLHAQSGCLSAVAAINQSGGVMGHQLQCETVDTKGDPADAVPVVEKALATTSNLIGILGPTSDETDAVAPTINAAHVPFFSTTGQSQFDSTSLSYFYRLVPPDSFAGSAMALWAHSQHLQRVAIVVGNDIGSQGTVGSITSSLKKLGSPSVVLNQVISLDGASYNSEVSQLINAHPQAILTEEDPQTAATYFSELKQQLGSAPFPSLIGANPILVPEWYTAVSTAIGPTLTQTNVVAENQTATTSGPAWEKFSAAIAKVAKSQPAVAAFSSNATVETEYDSVNLMALSAIAQKSTRPSDLNKEIVKMANGVPGAVSVLDFADGQKALQAGKSVRYVGVTGPIYLNSHHNAFGGIVMQKFTPTGDVTTVSGSGQILNQKALAQLS